MISHPLFLEFPNQNKSLLKTLAQCPSLPRVRSSAGVASLLRLISGLASWAQQTLARPDQSRARRPIPARACRPDRGSDGVAAGRQWRVHAHPGGRRGRQAPASRRDAGVRGLPERPAVARRPLVGPGRRARGPPGRRGRGRPRLPRPARHQQGALALSSHLLSRSVSRSRSAAEF
jgi:hypothetical protein